MELAIKAGLRASRAVAGVSVMVTQDGTSFTVTNAIRADAKFETLNESGQEAIIDFVDWLIDINDWAPTAMPAVGATIVSVIDGTSTTYSVESPGVGVLHWEWSDAGRSQIRVHSRKDSDYTVSIPNDFDISGNEIRR
jgi:hypothetical protein